MLKMSLFADANNPLSGRQGRIDSAPRRIGWIWPEVEDYTVGNGKDPHGILGYLA